MNRALHSFVTAMAAIVVAIVPCATPATAADTMTVAPPR
jgi:hypothetical protein